MAICTIANFFKILAIMDLQIMAKKKPMGWLGLTGIESVLQFSLYFEDIMGLCDYPRQL